MKLRSIAAAVLAAASVAAVTSTAAFASWWNVIDSDKVGNMTAAKASGNPADCVPASEVAGYTANMEAVSEVKLTQEENDGYYTGIFRISVTVDTSKMTAFRKEAEGQLLYAVVLDFGEGKDVNSRYLYTSPYFKKFTSEGGIIHEDRTNDYKFAGATEETGRYLVVWLDAAKESYSFGIGDSDSEHWASPKNDPVLLFYVDVNDTAAKRGDVNGDGAVNALDASRILRAAINGEKLDPKTADVNGDGMVNALDASAILKAMVGL